MTWNTLVELASPTVSANLRIRMVRVYKLGGTRVLLLRGSISSATPTRGGWADAASGICYGPGFLLQVCASGELDALPISAWCWREFCQWQGIATFPVHQPSAAQFL